jgi:hypothetical protein
LAVNNRDKNYTRAKMERRMAQIEESVARYLGQLDTADRQEPSEVLQTKTSRLREKIETLKGQMWRLERLKVEMLTTPDQQISLTDPDARSMATSGRGSGVVGYNVQIAVEANHHLIVMHEVTNDGTDRSQLSHVASETKAVLGVDKLDAVADRGYFNSEEIRTCEEAGITVTLPKPMTSNAKAEGRFGKQDFRYVADEDVYLCPAGEKLAYRYTTEENGLVLRRYWTNACQNCAIKPTCTTGKERRISRWEHEHILEAVQRRLDEHPEKMRQRRETVEHPFGTIKARMGATHFLMTTLPRVASEMALHVLAYNLTRVMNIMGIQPLMAAMRAWPTPAPSSRPRRDASPPPVSVFAQPRPIRTLAAVRTRFALIPLPHCSNQKLWKEQVAGSVAFARAALHDDGKKVDRADKNDIDAQPLIQPVHRRARRLWVGALSAEECEPECEA